MRKQQISMARPALTTRRVVSKVICQANKDGEDSIRKSVALPFAAMVAAAMVAGAFSPEEALAARSSGRAGGSSGFSARRAYSPPTASRASM